MAKAFERLLKDYDKVAASLTVGGPTLCAQTIVKDLQEIGPRWTGKFANSWEIRGPQGQTARGTGQEGQPQSIVFTDAPFTGRQALRTLSRTFLTKDKVVFTISNFSKYADEARDLAPSTFIYPGTEPIKKAIRGTRETGIRGDLEPGRGNNRITAILDWYKLYLGGGQVDKTIRVTMDGIKVGFR